MTDATNQPMPAFLDSTEAAKLLDISRAKFNSRVRAGLYQPAEFRKADPVSAEKLYRPRSLVMAEFMRKHDEVRTGVRT